MLVERRCGAERPYHCGRGRKFDAVQRRGEPEQQERGVAAFEDLIGPVYDVGAGLLVDDREDVAAEQGPAGYGGEGQRWRSRADAGQGGAKQVVADRHLVVPDLAMVGDRGD